MTDNTPKALKFDRRLIKSREFNEYAFKILDKELDKAGIPRNLITELNIQADGTIRIGPAGPDGQLREIARAKCHPDDAFNLEVGIALAVERAAAKLTEPFVPVQGERYYYLSGPNVIDWRYRGERYLMFIDDINVAIGNCFKSYDLASAHSADVFKRFEKAKLLLKRYIRKPGE